MDHFERHLRRKETEVEPYETMGEHRDLITRNEFHEICVQSGSRTLNTGTGNDDRFDLDALP